MRVPTTIIFLGIPYTVGSDIFLPPGLLPKGLGGVQEVSWGNQTPKAF
jgi:hypothetical protein